LLKVTINTKR